MYYYNSNELSVRSTAVVAFERPRLITSMARSVCMLESQQFSKRYLDAMCFFEMGPSSHPTDGHDNLTIGGD